MILNDIVKELNINVIDKWCFNSTRYIYFKYKDKGYCVSYSKNAKQKFVFSEEKVIKELRFHYIGNDVEILKEKIREVLNE